MIVRLFSALTLDVFRTFVHTTIGNGKRTGKVTFGTE